MSAIALRWSTDLVTFFHPQQWGLPLDLPYDRWDVEVSSNPRRFFERMLDGAAEAGLDGIELAPAPGGWVNALRAYGDAATFRRALEVRDLVVSSSYVLPIWLSRILDADATGDRGSAITQAKDEIARHAAFLRELGCSTLVTSTVPRAPFSYQSSDGLAADRFDAPVDRHLMERVAGEFNTIAVVAAAEDVRIAIHTDAYSLCSRPEDVEQLMLLTDPQQVMLCIDAGHIALDGADPLEVLRAHAQRAPVLHWKDCAAPLPPHELRGTPMERHDVMIRSFRLMGDGVIDWHEWTRLLAAKSWSGWGVAELDMSTDPIGEIRAGLAYYATELSAL